VLSPLIEKNKQHKTGNPTSPTAGTPMEVTHKQFGKTMRQRNQQITKKTIIWEKFKYNVMLLIE